MNLFIALLSFSCLLSSVAGITTTFDYASDHAVQFFTVPNNLMPGSVITAELHGASGGYNGGSGGYLIINFKPSVAWTVLAVQLGQMGSNASTFSTFGGGGGGASGGSSGGGATSISDAKFGIIAIAGGGGGGTQCSLGGDSGGNIGVGSKICSKVALNQNWYKNDGGNTLTKNAGRGTQYDNTLGCGTNALSGFYLSGGAGIINPCRNDAPANQQGGGGGGGGYYGGGGGAVSGGAGGSSFANTTLTQILFNTGGSRGNGKIIFTYTTVGSVVGPTQAPSPQTVTTPTLTTNKGKAAAKRGINSKARGVAITQNIRVNPN